jgi:hypothetical protein
MRIKIKKEYLNGSMFNFYMFSMRGMKIIKNECGMRSVIIDRYFDYKFIYYMFVFIFKVNYSNHLLFVFLKF